MAVLLSLEQTYFFFLCNKAYKYYRAEFGPRTSAVPSQFLMAKFSFQLSADEKLWHIDNLIFVQQNSPWMF